MPSIRSFRLRPTHLVSISLLFWGVVEAGIPKLGNSQEISLPPAYLEAIEDARTPEPEEIWPGLTAIVPYHPDLVWEGEPGDSRVLVAVWTSWNGYEANLGNAMELTQEVWVTPVPELQQFCQNYTPTAEVSLPYRLNQLLGLPPDNPDKVRQVVHLWVSPNDVFRPSFDPEIRDRTSEIGFRPDSWYGTLSADYRDWFDRQYQQRYASDGVAYPWTQLGYTYDWGNVEDWHSIDGDRPSEVGLSEFVIREQATVDVANVATVEAYCQPLRGIQNSKFRVRLEKFGGKKIYTPNFSQN